MSKIEHVFNKDQNLLGVSCIVPFADQNDIVSNHNFRASTSC
jgi:hypothetical protein